MEHRARRELEDALGILGKPAGGTGGHRWWNGIGLRHAVMLPRSLHLAGTAPSARDDDAVDHVDHAVVSQDIGGAGLGALYRDTTHGGKRDQAIQAQATAEHLH